MSDDIRICCRICLDVESDHVSIFGDPTIHLHLRSCLGLHISSNDALPKVICASCVSQLSDFYNFQLNARCSQDWLESSIQEKLKKSSEKTQVQPLPDSEYNSDSLLEFLNNTANIEEYLNNLGKEDIPSIVNLLDRNEKVIEAKSKVSKPPTPKKKEAMVEKCINMEIDMLESEAEVVKEILMKETEPKTKLMKHMEKLICFGCKTKFETVHKLTQHFSVCDRVSRTCVHCHILFDSKQQMLQHSTIHNTPLTCNCGKEFPSQEKLQQHHRVCIVEYGPALGCQYRCKQCGAQFKERFQIYRHAKEHVMEADERVCDICGHKFRGDEALTKHREVHEKTKDVMYRCKVCAYTSADHSQIYLHVKGHVKAPEPTRHLCESCGCSFATTTSLMRHVAKHKNGVYKCTICDKNFPNSKLRDDHMSDHSTMTICEKCGCNFNNLNLDSHKCI